MNFLRDFPVIISYGIFPFIMIFDRNFMGSGLFRAWIDILFVCWFVAAIIKILLSRRVHVLFNLNDDFFRLAVICLSTVIFLKFFISPVLTADGFSFVPWAMELKPLFYFSVALTGMMAFAPPPAATYVKLGKVLAVLIVASVFLESVEQGRLVRSHGSGEMNYDAFLLLIAFLISMFNKQLNAARLDICWLFFGLLCTMSRTVMLITIVCIFLVSNLEAYKKILLGFVSSCVIVLSFIVRDLPLDQLESMDRYWMWVSAFDYLTSSWNHFFFGASPGSSIGLDIPLQLEWLWEKQSEEWGVVGIYPFHLHSMWLRLLVTWGGGVSLLLLVVFVSCYFLSENKMTKSLVIAIFLGGMSMGVLYLSNVAIVIATVLWAKDNSKYER